MRRKFISEMEYPDISHEDAKRLCPWAARIINVDGGIMAFESVEDCEIWKNQH